MRTALLDRRFGTHGGHPKNSWKEETLSKGLGSGNSFTFIDAFSPSMTGSLEVGVDYSPLVDYDLVYMRVRDGNCVKAMKELMEQCPNLVIIAYSDELSNYNINKMDGASWLYEASFYCDVMTSGFPKKYDRSKHERLGILNWVFCPFGGYVEEWQKLSKKRNVKNLVSGMLHLRSFMDGGSGDKIHSRTFKVMKKLQDKHGVDCRFFLNFDGHKLLPEIEPYIKKLGLNVELVKFVPNAQFYRMLGESKVFMEEFQCPNCSRASMVAGAMGVAHVGTDMNTPSNICFPDTTVEHGDWEAFYRVAEKLLIDNGFRKTVEDRAILNSYYFGFEAFKSRLIKLYEMSKFRREKNE